MSNAKSIITLNGKTYDANTGTVIDVVVRHPHRPVAPVAAAAPKVAAPQPRSPAAPAHAHREHHAHTARDVHHRTEHAHTLMREAVKKPEHTKTSHASAQLDTQSVTTHNTAPAAHNDIQAARLKRASEIAKSDRIHRFNLDSSESTPDIHVPQRHEPLPVKPAPTINATSHQDVLDTTAPTTTSDLFSNALHNATSHQETSPKLPRRHQRVAKKLGITAGMANLGVSLFAAFVLGGFFLYQNLPNLSMHVAAARAGIHGTLPGYVPSGFSMSKGIEANSGQIVVSFHSNSDARNFTLTQAASGWDSQTLHDSYVASAIPSAQTLQEANGQTVFLDGSTATWVNGGIWYKVQGNSSLSSSQLLKIANSF